MPRLRVRAYLSAPVALTAPLHLDGLLVSCAEVVAGRHVTRTCEAGEIVRPPIPLCAVSLLGRSAYLGSAAESAPNARRMSEHLTRRRDADDLDHLTKPVDTRSGPGRDVMLRFPILLTPYVEWQAVGSRRPMLKLLRRRVQAVGMLRRHGYGVVERWEIESVEESPDTVLVSRGRARRNLPVEWLEAPEVVERVPLSAPYWHSATVGDGVLAGRLTGLRPDVLRKAAACR
jgi:hypothetical protein